MVYYGQKYKIPSQGVKLMKKNSLCFLMILMVYFPWPAWAETMYITENQDVLIRGGKGNSFKILAIKKAYAPVELLRDEGDYSYIRTEGGIEGWVLSRYLTRDLPKPMIIDKLNAEIEKLRQANTTLSQEFQQLQEQKKSLESSSVALEQKATALERQYKDLKSASANVLQLKQAHDKLEQENEQYARSAAELAKKNEQLQSNSALMWYIAGAATLLIGVAIGMFMQSLKNKKKKSFSF
jgi:SH3 domain protein